MNRVIFVGMHNKEPFKPLDSKSKSGKLIDKVIEKVASKNIVKTNLFEVEYLPNDYTEIKELKRLWLDKYEPSTSDVIVLLGGVVQKNFPQIGFLRTIKVGHPSPVFSNEAKEEYSERVSRLINEKLSQHQ